jgi:ABC-2 type transport system permease protein
VPDWVPLLGRFLALVAMLVVLQAVLMAAGVLLQAVQGYTTSSRACTCASCSG